MENLENLSLYLTSKFRAENFDSEARNPKHFFNLNRVVFTHMAQFLDIESMHTLREIMPGEETECLKPWCEFSSGILAIEIRGLLKLYHRSTSSEQRYWCIKVALAGLCYTLTLTDLVEIEFGSPIGATLTQLVIFNKCTPIIRASDRLDLIDLYLGLIKYIAKYDKIETLILIGIPDESILVQFLHLEENIERIYSLGYRRIGMDEELRLSTNCPKLVFMYRSTNNTQRVGNEVEVIITRDAAIRDYEMGFMRTTLDLVGISAFETQLHSNRSISCYGNELTYPWLSDRWVFITDPRGLPTTYMTSNVVFPDARITDYKAPRLRPSRTLLTADLQRIFFNGRTESHRMFMYELEDVL